jgi:hypothetical protein
MPNLPKSIILKNYSDVFEEYDSTAVAIIPGQLLELESGGDVQAHSVAGGTVLPMFAKEDALQGKSVRDAYLASDKIQVWIPGRGDQVYAIVADGQDISIGDFLESDGNGYLQAAPVDSSGVPTVAQSIVAVALEAVDTAASDSSLAPLGLAKRIKVRII